MGLLMLGSLPALWPPGNGIEWTLIDTIGHALTVYEFWTQRLMLCSMLEELHTP